MSSQSATNARKTGLSRVLGIPSLVLFGLAYMVPLTVFTTYGPVEQLTEGHLPGAYLVTLIAMLFTALSYGKMSRLFPVAGSAYTYAQRSFGGNVGFIVGWSLMLDYILLPMINYLVIGLYLAAAFPAIPQWVWILLGILIVTVLNILGIKSVARMNVVLIAAQAAFIVLFLILSIRTISGGSEVSVFGPFFGDNAEFGLIMTGASILCLSFLGFDAISTLSEEATNPKRSIPRAILITTLTGGLIFIGLSLVAHWVFPDWQSFSSPDTASLDVMQKAGGAFLSNFFTAAYVAGAFASALASQASVSRILYSMGRDGVLPKRFFGQLNRRFSTPANATILVGVVSLIALFIDLALAASIISFGALVAFTFVNISVVKSHAIDRRDRKGIAVLTNIVLPLIGFGLSIWLWTSLPGTSFVVGLIWAGMGLIYLAGLTKLFRVKPPQMDLAE
ncbi:APC family permease [Saxibacter everestensis]|uniref:APC family permease n=1 Tax=Saxibacter everestensis TaxID=2909229 RepID=A0ABY8QQI6_9MICO|nr:APC family permease [Brevibacteriaceae bacterium ZFBP1038]